MAVRHYSKISLRDLVSDCEENLNRNKDKSKTAMFNKKVVEAKKAKGKFEDMEEIIRNANL